MTLTEANEHSDRLEDGDFSSIYEDEDFDTEKPRIADEEELATDRQKVTFQPSEESITCYGTPEDDEAIEFLDRRYALEDEITLENGEKVRLQLTDEQKLKRDVISSLLAARDARRAINAPTRSDSRTRRNL